MKKDLLFQYLDEGTTPVSLPEGLHLEITTPTLRGVLRKENNLTELVWKWLALGRCSLFQVKNAEGVIVHQSMMVGRNPKFSFLRENEYEIGPCMTTEEYRGLGIYPYVLGICVRALPDGERGEHYMFVSPDHLSSIRGVEKAGFRVIGHVERRRFGIWKKVKETEAGHT